MSVLNATSILHPDTQHVTPPGVKFSDGRQMGSILTGRRTIKFQPQTPGPFSPNGQYAIEFNISTNGDELADGPTGKLKYDYVRWVSSGGSAVSSCLEDGPAWIKSVTLTCAGVPTEYINNYNYMSNYFTYMTATKAWLETQGLTSNYYLDLITADFWKAMASCQQSNATVGVAQLASGPWAVGKAADTSSLAVPAFDSTSASTATFCHALSLVGFFRAQRYWPLKHLNKVVLRILLEESAKCHVVISNDPAAAVTTIGGAAVVPYTLNYQISQVSLDIDVVTPHPVFTEALTRLIMGSPVGLGIVCDSFEDQFQQKQAGGAQQTVVTNISRSKVSSIWTVFRDANTVTLPPYRKLSTFLWCGLKFYQYQIGTRLWPDFPVGQSVAEPLVVTNWTESIPGSEKNFPPGKGGIGPGVPDFSTWVTGGSSAYHAYKAWGIPHVIATTNTVNTTAGTQTAAAYDASLNFIYTGGMAEMWAMLQESFNLFNSQLARGLTDYPNYLMARGPPIPVLNSFTNNMGGVFAPGASGATWTGAELNNLVYTADNSASSALAAYTALDHLSHTLTFRPPRFSTGIDLEVVPDLMMGIDLRASSPNVYWNGTYALQGPTTMVNRAQGTQGAMSCDFHFFVHFIQMLVIMQGAIRVVS